ncbi:MAG TPA: nickel pincer cofactor biosynthesis protein LarB [bacterium]|nr:nickel pincer cofactor biosynthesis protein LarB [bacterium]HPQ66545.1 nickel pincer cofactor biosynthesis protein LarB [bacterium]
MNDLDLDFDREERLGFPEIVYGEFKTPEQIRRIVGLCRARSRPLLVTRLSGAAAAELEGGTYDPVSRTLTVSAGAPPRRSGLVGLVCAGASDLPVVAEAGAVLDFLGIASRVFADVGVAGIHRLLSRLEELRECDLIVCAAGFEGALPSVVAGLLPQPVIGVPTSVGYGVAAGGKTALNAMLCSCANGLLVVNIDNGCGAALAAARMLGRRSKP